MTGLSPTAPGAAEGSPPPPRAVKEARVRLAQALSPDALSQVIRAVVREGSLYLPHGLC